MIERAVSSRKEKEKPPADEQTSKADWTRGRQLKESGSSQLEVKGARTSPV